MRTLLAATAVAVALATGCLLVPAGAAATRTDGRCLSNQLQRVPGGDQSLRGSVPVAFIHGITSSPQIWQPSSSGSIAGQAARMAGVTAWTFSYAAHSLDWVTNPAIGQAFAQDLSCLARASGHQVVVIAHSMGGLATQDALGYPGTPAAGQVAELVTIGTPYQGSALLSAVQAATNGPGALVGSVVAPKELALAEALMSACAGLHDVTSANPCGFVTVARTQLGIALEEHSAQISALPPWPTRLPVDDIAGNLRLSVPLGLFHLTANFGDVPVSLPSATAHNTIGSPYIRSCSVVTLLAMVRLDPGPCFHTHLPHDGDVITKAVRAIRAAVAAQLSTTVPVVACPTSYGLGPGMVKPRYPATETIPVPPQLGSQLAYYSDQARWVQPILGPRGWSCSADIGADVSLGIQIYPPGGSAKGPVQVNARNDAGCEGCIYQDACQLIPHTAAELGYTDMPCPVARTAGQTVTFLAGSPAESATGTDVVSFTDPPGVKGYAAASGGQYPATGIMLYSWGSQHPNNNVSVLDCTLPSSQSMLCTTILSVFRQQNWIGH